LQLTKYIISNGSECLGSILVVKPCGVKPKTNTTTVIWSLLCLLLLLLFRSKIFILFIYAECREGVWGIGGAVPFILEVRIIGRYALRFISLYFGQYCAKFLVVRKRRIDARCAER
jgi:hypothetical protein